jgi:hypothetical protein
MKRLLFLLPVVSIASSGCTLVTENRVFPKPAFVWSREAIEQRQEKRNYQHMVDKVPTNSPAW